MAPTKARAKLPVNKFVDAIAYLEDITTIHTDPNFASMRSNLMRGGSDGAVSDDMVRVLEVLGIANAVDPHFSGTSKHHAHGIQAAFDAGILSAEVRKWLMRRDTGSGAHALGESDKGCRAFLLTRLGRCEHVPVPCDRVPAGRCRPGNGKLVSFGQIRHIFPSSPHIFLQDSGWICRPGRWVAHSNTHDLDMCSTGGNGCKQQPCLINRLLYLNK
jgi:hypothetical protein